MLEPLSYLVLGGFATAVILTMDLLTIFGVISGKPNFLPTSWKYVIENEAIHSRFTIWLDGLQGH